VPFSAVFVELFFVMSSIWTDSYYMIFGFVLVAFLILAVVCAEVSIITTYIRLSAENYKWWWPSIIVPGSTSLYVLVYSAVYFLKLESSLWVTYVVYFGYMTLVSVGVFLTCGSVGFFAALYFNVKIYSSIKID
jgi:transmembrane 9 superfamily protein 2/4